MLSRCLLPLGAVLALLPPSAEAAFPGRDGRIAFAGGIRPGISTVRADGTGLVSFNFGNASDPFANAFASAYSPSGRRIAFTTSLDGHAVLAVADAGGGHARSLGVVGYRPRWSPDGRRLVFVDRRTFGGAPQANVWVLDVARRKRTRVTYRGGMFPTWSSRGAIAFTRTTRLTGPLFRSVDLFLVTPRAGGTWSKARRLTRHGGFQGDFSPDGAKLVFVRSQLTSSGDGVEALYTLRLSTGHTQRVANLAGQHPAYSPDGKHLVWDSGDMISPPGLSTASLDGQHLRTLPRGGSPSWQPLGSARDSPRGPG